MSVTHQAEREHGGCSQHSVDSISYEFDRHWKGILSESVERKRRFCHCFNVKVPKY